MGSKLALRWVQLVLEANRTDALDTQVDRRTHAGQARVNSAHEFFHGITMGQPVMDEADRRRRERHQDTERRGHTPLNTAQHAADRADTARQHMDRRYHPRKVQRRIARFETDLRKTDRNLAEAVASGHETARDSS